MADFQMILNLSCGNIEVEITSHFFKKLKIIFFPVAGIELQSKFN